MNSVKVRIFPLHYATADELRHIDIDQYLYDIETDIYGAFDDFEYEPLLFRALFIRLISDQKSLFKLISESCGHRKESDIIPILPCEVDLNDLKTACKKNDERYHAMKDVLGRDNQFVSKNAPINVVMLLYNGQYYGHVFCWDLVFQIKPDTQDPRDYETLKYFNGSKLTFMLGIRSRIDSLFLSLCGINLKGVGLFLSEAVRRHAVANGSSMMIVPEPWGPMIGILENFGFKEVIQNKYHKDFKKLPNYLVYRIDSNTPKFTEYWNHCSECFYLLDIDEPFQDFPDLEVVDYSI